MKDRYEIDIRWSNEDECYVAKVPELSGCMAHGDRREDALREIQVAMDLWLEVAREHGDPVPEPRVMA
jgi:predicted RNase H-like HicB family nuclease